MGEGFVVETEGVGIFEQTCLGDGDPGSANSNAIRAF